MRRFILYFTLLLSVSASAQVVTQSPKGYFGTGAVPNTKLATETNPVVDNNIATPDSLRLITKTVDGKKTTTLTLPWFTRYMQQFVTNSFAPVSGSANYIQNQGSVQQSAQSWYSTAKFGSFPSGNYAQIDGSNILLSGNSGAITAQLNNGNLSLSKNGFNFSIISGAIGGYGSVITGNARFADRLQVVQSPVSSIDVIRRIDLDSTLNGQPADLSEVGTGIPDYFSALKTSDAKWKSYPTTLFAKTTDTTLFVRKNGNSSITNLNYKTNGTAGNGYVMLRSQSVSPVSTASNLTLYSDSLNRISWKNSTHRRTIRVSRTADMTISAPYRLNPTLADSTDVAASLALKLDKQQNSTFSPFNSPYQFGQYIAGGTSYTAFSTFTTSIPLNYTNRIGGIMGVSPQNYGLAGAGIADIQKRIYGLYISATDMQVITQETAANDIAVYGSNADKMANWQKMSDALAAYSAIPNSQKKFGQSTDITYSGTWANSTYYNGLISKQSTTNGNTATTTSSGTTVYVAYTMLDGNGGTASVTVDGVSAGTINCFGQNGSTINTLFSNTNGSALLSVTGLSAGSHTIVVTVTSATSASNRVIIDWIAGNSGANSTWPSVYLFDPIQILSSTNITAYRTMVYNTVNRMRADGLKVNEVYVRPLNTSTEVAPDGGHPNDAGHKVFADALKFVVDSTLNIMAADTPKKITAVRLSGGKIVDAVTNNGAILTKPSIYSLNAKQDGATLGSDLITSITATNWTLTGGRYVHTPGDVNPITINYTARIGALYQVTLGISSGSGGATSIDVGTTAGTKINLGTLVGSGTYTYSYTATSTEPIIFTPISSSTISVSVVSVKEGVDKSDATIRYYDANNNLTSETRVTNQSVTSNGFGAGPYLTTDAYDVFNQGYGAGGKALAPKNSTNIGAFTGESSNGIGNVHINNASGRNDNGNYNTLINGGATPTFSSTFNNNVIINGTTVADVTGSNQLNILNDLYRNSAGNWGFGANNNPSAKLTITPGAVGATVVGGQNVNYGALITTSSNRSGIDVISGNDFLNNAGVNGGFNWRHPYADGSSNNDGSFKPVSVSHGSPLVMTAWINKYGRGYFAGNILLPNVAGVSGTDSIMVKQGGQPKTIAANSYVTVASASNVVTSSASTLSLAYTQDVFFNGTTATYTLPAIAAASKGRYYQITVSNMGTGNITVNSNAGGNDIYLNAATNTDVISPGGVVTYMSNGVIFKKQ